MRNMDGTNNALGGILLPMDSGEQFLSHSMLEDDEELPAIGHLDDFSIPVSSDGQPLPATVKARMPDGSYQTVTLIPQNIEDGSVIYTVQFEDDESKTLAEKSLVDSNETIDFSRLADKIDQIDNPWKKLTKDQIESSSKCQFFPDLAQKIDKIVVKNESIISQSSIPLKKDLTFKQSERSILKPVISSIQKKRSVFVKNSPEYFVLPNNDSPLGSSNNPIQLIKDGQTFHSRHPLSGDMLRQIANILENKKSCNNTKQTFRVWYANDPQAKDKPIEDTNDIISQQLSESTKTMEIRIKEKSKITDETSDTEDDLETNSKRAKFSRTRSGRLSKPPHYIAKNYQNFDLQANARSFEDTPNVDNAASIRLIENVNMLPAPTRRSSKRNFRPDWRCPICHKVYLGRKQMQGHFKKFPEHNIHSETMQETNKIIKRRLPLSKLKRELLYLDKSKLRQAFDPLIADLFSLWDLLLLRVHKVSGNGISDVNILLEELTTFVDKLTKLGEDLLSPVFTTSSNIDEPLVAIDRMDVAMALGVETGLFRVNTDQLHLLRVPDECREDVASQQDQDQDTDGEILEPSNGPTELATKFEPNLSTKLLECSNDSIDIDSSSKDVEVEEDKKEWVDTKVDVTNSELLSELLGDLPSNVPSSNPLLWQTEKQVRSVKQERTKEDKRKTSSERSSNWMRLFKDSGQMPKIRTGRLTSTPEIAQDRDLFSTEPARRNSISGFVPREGTVTERPVEELELHDLLDDFLPDGSNGPVPERRPACSSIESIINETLFTGPAPPRNDNIQHSIDENLDFLNR